jgi:hypothetical protein
LRRWFAQLLHLVDALQAARVQLGVAHFRTLRPPSRRKARSSRS